MRKTLVCSASRVISFRIMKCFEAPTRRTSHFIAGEISLKCPLVAVSTKSTDCSLVSATNLSEVLQGCDWSAAPVGTAAAIGYSRQSQLQCSPVQSVAHGGRVLSVNLKLYCSVARSRAVAIAVHATQPRHGDSPITLLVRILLSRLSYVSDGFC